MSVNSKMTAIANATRALDGSTAALTLDGIASKLGVEKTNIAAALAAIAEKGVEVPSGSKSDALASLIASIEAGGGGDYEIMTGVFVPAEDIAVANNAAYAVAEHNADKYPVAFICYTENFTSGYGLRQSLTSPVSTSYGILSAWHGEYTTTVPTAKYKNYQDTSLSFHNKGYVLGASASTKLLAGVSHYWIAMFEK